MSFKYNALQWRHMQFMYLKYLATGLFQPFVHTNNKGKNKALHYCPFEGEPTGDRYIPLRGSK